MCCVPHGITGEMSAISKHRAQIRSMHVLSIFSRILAKWREHDSVLHGHPSNLQRLEKLWNGFAILNERAAGGWPLLRCKVRNTGCWLVDITVRRQSIGVTTARAEILLRLALWHMLYDVMVSGRHCFAKGVINEFE